MPRIHILGAAGAGTSTLGCALAARLRVLWFDSDNYYWLPTAPPYAHKRPKPERDRRMRDDLHTYDDWVWSGSAVSWNVGAPERITLCVFLTLPADLRLARLRAREEEEFGAVPYVTREEFEAEMEEFLAWAARYDEGGLEVRSKQLQEQWMATLRCPILRIDGDLTTDERVERVLAALDGPST